MYMMQFVKHYKAHQNAVILKTCVKLKQVAAEPGVSLEFQFDWTKLVATVHVCQHLIVFHAFLCAGDPIAQSDSEDMP